MKNSLLAMAALLLVPLAQAEVYQVDLSPNGVPGLSPDNEVPAVTNSTGSGGEILSGISFDTETSVLSIAIGYGSAAGFTDLTGPATGMHIHGPAAADASAGVVVSLSTNSFPALDPSTGGIIFGNVVLPADQVSNLLSGLLYINIHTATNPAGEVRGQLVPQLESPPEIVCPEPVTAECGSITTVSVQVSDADDDALTLVWTVNGTAMQTNELAAGTTVTPVEQSFDAIYQLGTNEVSFVVTDSTGKSAECSTTVVVEDTAPPEITKLEANRRYLWPPNHKMVPVNFTAKVTDLCGGTSWKITSITSNQPDNGLGDGNTSNDWVITGDHTASLRAERSGKEGMREYTVTVQAEDESGNLSETKSIIIYVPHDFSTLRQVMKLK